MPKTFTRSEWGARSATGGPGLLYASTVESIALHWPASTKPIRGVEAVKAALRAWQAYHMDTHGWSDIGYQVAVDQDGNRYVLRGLDVQSGANGDTGTNKANGALLLILAPGEQPTPAMMKAARSVIADHRALFSKSRGVKGHADVRPEPTSCPGPIVLALIRAGEFEPGPSPRDLMRADLTAAIRAAKKAGALATEQGRTRVANATERVGRALRDARKRVPKD